MLVLGDEAQRYGLGISLLERLHNHYRALGAVTNQYIAHLVTNYRCHSSILSLSERLFYRAPLKCEVPPKSTHPDAPFPLVFVCSSIDGSIQLVNESFNEDEALIALKEVAKYANRWPDDRWGSKDFSQTCFISPTRSQVGASSFLSWLASFYFCSTILDHSCFQTCQRD